ncbi:hypothetical protein AJ79_04699 [Helicocarpus griseus UAMH5409]|uniref:Uncharacterized protein n=1 Tax=Helicocarpus griseus UAMH5409 TaxID=1447875 RepID=A0A2B7XTH7_9EURO|nr:hypothetical protein AJ79_04699 [Helicocarpus griseus UAMH5409]
MKSNFLFATALFTLAASQQASVPADLAESFSDSGTDGLQVSFGGDASEGLTDGDTVRPQDISNPPTFALGDSSGVNRGISYMIMMIDTTDDNARKVQYMQSGFRASGDKTKLEAEGEPAVPYEPPTLDGGPRQFSFLLYRQRGQQASQLSEVPSGGASFDVKSFESENNLQPPRAGMAIMVDENAVPSPSASASPSASQTQTSVVIVAPSATGGSSDLEGAAAEGPGGDNSGAAGLHGAVYTGTYVAIFVLFVQAGWYVFVL